MPYHTENASATLAIARKAMSLRLSSMAARSTMRRSTSRPCAMNMNPAQASSVPTGNAQRTLALMKFAPKAATDCSRRRA